MATHGAKPNRALLCSFATEVQPRALQQTLGCWRNSQLPQYPSRGASSVLRAGNQSWTGRGPCTRGAHIQVGRWTCGCRGRSEHRRGTHGLTKTWALSLQRRGAEPCLGKGQAQVGRGCLGGSRTGQRHPGWRRTVHLRGDDTLRLVMG